MDPEDDSIQRYVVRRYAHDPERRERRHQVVVAYDAKREYQKAIKRLSDDLARRRADGQPIDPQEHYSGVILEAGYLRRQRDGRVLRAAIRHRVTISDQLLERLDLPSNVGLLVARSDESR